MPRLILLQSGSALDLERGQLVGVLNHRVIFRGPVGSVDSVTLGPGTTIGRHAIDALLAEGASIFYQGFGGVHLGTLAPPDAGRARLRLTQGAAAANERMRLRFARLFLESKIEGQLFAIAAAKRAIPPEQQRVIRSLREIAKRVPDLPTLGSLRGAEGAASGLYFQLFGLRVAAPFEFSRRHRRPPPDPVNALLSLGYVLLGRVAEEHLLCAGLEPGIGFLHETYRGSPALALDLIEPYRAPFVDRWVLGLLNRSMVRPSDFEPGEQGGVLLRASKLKRVVETFYDELAKERRLPMGMSSVDLALASDSKRLAGRLRKIKVADLASGTVSNLDGED